MSLKFKNGPLKHGKRENKQPSQLSKSIKICKTKELRCGLWPYLVLSMEMGLFQIAIFEVDVLAIKSLRSGTCIIKKGKTGCQGLHSMWSAVSNFDEVKEKEV